MQTNWTIGDPDRLRYTHHEWLKSEQDMRALFNDCPTAIENTLEVLNKIERFGIASPNMECLLQETSIKSDGISGWTPYQEALAYANQKYGEGKLARIVKYRSLGKKEACNRVARAFNLSLYDLISGKYPLECKLIQEVRDVEKLLEGRIYTRMACDSYAICPSGPIMERIPCISYSASGDTGPALCTEYDIHSEEIADMIIVK